ncbi:MAG TPA: hypothetical protein VGF55_23030 [Gemmataceae bacterium]|jgi:hypothetical protein
MASVPATPAAETVEQRVARLLRTWREQTAYLSSSTQLTAHPAYQELISLGPAALPFLFRDLEQTGDGHLSKALAALTGAHPVPAEDRGNVRKVADAWLRWARENGWRW